MGLVAWRAGGWPARGGMGWCVEGSLGGGRRERRWWRVGGVGGSGWEGGRVAVGCAGARAVSAGGGARVRGGVGGVVRAWGEVWNSGWRRACKAARWTWRGAVGRWRVRRVMVRRAVLCVRACGVSPRSTRWGRAGVALWRAARWWVWCWDCESVRDAVRRVWCGAGWVRGAARAGVGRAAPCSRSRVARACWEARVRRRGWAVQGCALWVLARWVVLGSALRRAWRPHARALGAASRPYRQARLWKRWTPNGMGWKPHVLAAPLQLLELW